MKRRTFLARASAGLAATAVTAPAIAQATPPVKWRLASSFPKSLDTIYGAGAFFCERVGKLTEGKFEIVSSVYRLRQSACTLGTSAML